MQSSARLTRRSLLSAAAATVLATGCGRSTTSDSVLKVFNWSDYIDPAMIVGFEKDHQCSVVYDNFSSDSELEARLATGGGAYDVVFPSDRAMYSLQAKGLLQPLQKERLTNIDNLDSAYLKLPFDKDNQFSLPYFWGTVGVGVRKDHVSKAVTGFDVLFDPDFSGRITMLDDLENVISIMLIKLGRPLIPVVQRDLDDVRDELLAQRPLVQAYTSDAYRERLISGQAWVSLGWSGDLLQAADIAEEEEKDTVDVIVPQSGTLKWLDSMAIPARATNVELAHHFLDYLLDESVAAKNAEYVHYATPNAAAWGKIPKEMAEDQRIYPPAATEAKCQWLVDRGEGIRDFEKVWRQVRS